MLLHVYLLVNHNTMYNVVVCSPEQSGTIAHSSLLNTLKWDLIIVCDTCTKYELN